jgi:hypothetical protein
LRRGCGSRPHGVDRPDSAGSRRKQKNLHKCLNPLTCIEHLFKKSSREES